MGKNNEIIYSKKIAINKCVYNVHPIYNLYAASEDGEIIHIIKQKLK